MNHYEIGHLNTRNYRAHRALIAVTAILLFALAILTSIALWSDDLLRQLLERWGFN